MDNSVPCKVCGKPTIMRGTRLCDSCWKVIHRVAQVNDPRLIVEMLARADKLEPVLQWCSSNVKHRIVWGVV